MRLPSGGLVFENRVRWATLSLHKAELTELVGPSRHRITEDGRSLLAAEELRSTATSSFAPAPTYLTWHEDMGIAEPERSRTIGDGWGAGQRVAGSCRARRAPRTAVRHRLGGCDRLGSDGRCLRAVARSDRRPGERRVCRQRGRGGAGKRATRCSTSSTACGIVTWSSRPSRHRERCLLGWVAGAYRYLEEPIAEHYNHSREVRWFARVSRDELSYGARNSLGTLLTLSRPGFTGELLRLAEIHRDDDPPGPLEQGRNRRERRPNRSGPAWRSRPPPPSLERASFAEFPTFSRPLMPMLDQLHAGELALPDFQRSFVWAPDATAELVVSIMRGFPAGNLLFLRGGSSKFKTRPAEGGPPSRGNRPISFSTVSSA